MKLLMAKKLLQRLSLLPEKGSATVASTKSTRLFWPTRSTEVVGLFRNVKLISLAEEKPLQEVQLLKLPALYPPPLSAQSPARTSRTTPTKAEIPPPAKEETLLVVQIRKQKPLKNTSNVFRSGQAGIL